MKRSLILVLCTLVILLTSCETSEEEPFCSESDIFVAGVCHDRTAPQLIGIEDIDSSFGVDFDPLNGVSAIDAIDGDISENIIVTGEVDSDDLGVYLIKYYVTDSSGNDFEALRFVTVKYVNTSDITKIDNGDFSSDLENWIVFNTESGGRGNFSVVDGHLEVEVLAINEGIAWEPRIHTEEIYLEQGKSYKISFDAKSDLPRSIHVHVGEVLSTYPYFTSFMHNGTKIHDLTTSYRTYNATFTMTNSTSLNGGLLFEFGDVLGAIGTDNLITTVYIDNVTLTEIIY